MSNLNLKQSVFRNILTINRRHCNVQCIYNSTASSSTTTTNSKDEYIVEEGDEPLQQTTILIDDQAIAQREEQIERSRNKSRLLVQHRNILNGVKPYDEPQSWIHSTVKYNRTMFGRYGLASGVDPKLCFLNKKELQKNTEYERVAFPVSFNKMVKINQQQKEDKKKQTLERENTIAKKLEKLDQWTSDLNAKIAKREADARVVKERKDRLVEEVRRQFGFKVDVKDERFKELLLQKEKEDKKKQKEARKKANDEKMLARLKEKHNIELKPVAKAPEPTPST